MTEYKGKRNIEEEVDIVIRHIKDLIENGEANPGDRLPAERKLSAETGVSRAKVRLALERLESYGVLMILPQSGSVLVQHPRTALVRQLSNILEGSNYDFNSLVQVRNLLEAESVRLCALNHNDADIAILERSVQDFIENAYSPARDEKDFAFHTTIARCSHNEVIYQLLLMITPHVLVFYRKLKACSSSPEGVIAEHRRILDCIKRGDAPAAVEALKQHFADITAFAASNKGEVPRMRL